VTRPTAIESALRQPRRTLAIVLLGIPLACWLWILPMARDMYGSMTGLSAWMMTSSWDTTHVVLLWAMWAVMMAGMMIPTATPLVLLYAGAARGQSDDGSPAARIYALAAGYLFVWTAFSVAATALQRLLAIALALTPMMEPATPAVAGALLLVAGVYQLTPLKLACLRSCRSPMSLFNFRWRRGTAGAFRMGVDHGVHCLGCCWALMLLLFAGGVMNLTVILALTLWVGVEKLAPFGERTAGISGAILCVAGAWMMVG
jgi:predicted metal-binding membrane protein